MRKKIWFLLGVACVVFIVGMAWRGIVLAGTEGQKGTLAPTATLSQSITPQDIKDITPLPAVTLSQGREDIRPADATSVPLPTETAVPTETPVHLEGEKADPVHDDMLPETEEGAEENGRQEEHPVLLEEDYASYDNTKQAWWFLRNTAHLCSKGGEAFPIEPFHAYYANVHTAEDDKVFYLTFDCGYENGFTPTILDILKKYEIHAAFFVTADFLRKYPEYAVRMKEEGHIVGNHTVRHLSTPSLSVSEIQDELSTVEQIMLELTGYELDRYFRPPLGEYSERTLRVSDNLGYKTIFWSLAYHDYDVNNQPGKEYVLEHFRQYHHSGGISLIHTISQSNTEALEEVILLLMEEGYRFGVLSEL